MSDQRWLNRRIDDYFKVSKFLKSRRSHSITSSVFVGWIIRLFDKTIFCYTVHDYLFGLFEWGGAEEHDLHRRPTITSIIIHGWILNVTCINVPIIFTTEIFRQRNRIWLCRSSFIAQWGFSEDKFWIASNNHDVKEKDWQQI